MLLRMWCPFPRSTSVNSMHLSIITLLMMKTMAVAVAGFIPFVFLITSVYPGLFNPVWSWLHHFGRHFYSTNSLLLLIFRSHRSVLRVPPRFIIHVRLWRKHGDRKIRNLCNSHACFIWWNILFLSRFYYCELIVFISHACKSACFCTVSRHNQHTQYNSLFLNQRISCLFFFLFN